MANRRVNLVFSGFDQRMFPFCEHVAWAAKQVPNMRVTGPMPLPRQIMRRGVLKSPFKYGSSRELWEKRTHKRLIVYETDANTHHKFLKFLDQVMEPVVAVKVQEHSFHRLENFYRKKLLTAKKQ